MNKILQINLGGHALTIDEDAYQHLANYLDEVRLRLDEHEGRDEILRDIEGRLGELITSRLEGRSIVSLADVQAAIEVMGKPEEFDSASGNESGSSPKSSRGKNLRLGRRLYRDESDAVIGGVCSGLSAYFGLNDPIWMRLIFILLALISFGFWMPAYILLWMLMPPAKTAAERLAMRGEAPTLENIVREVEHGAERLAQRAKAFGERAAVRMETVSSSSASGCATLLARFFKGVAIFFAIGLISLLGTLWVAGTIAFFTERSQIALQSPLPIEASYLGFVNFFFLVGIPVVGLLTWLFRTIFRLQVPRWLGPGMVALWVLNLISLGLLAIWGVREYRVEGSVNQTIDFSTLTSDTLYVQFNPPSIYKYTIFRFEIEENVASIPLIEVKRSETARFEGNSSLFARGATQEEAYEHAKRIPFKVVLSGNTLTIPGQIRMLPGGWRAQRAKVTLYVPEGKYIVFKEGAHEHVRADYVNELYPIEENPGKAFQMTSLGLSCAHCEPADDDSFSEVNQFILEGNLDVDIIYSETFSVHCPGATAETDYASVVRKGNALVVSATESKGSGPLRCIVHTTNFASLTAKGKGRITLQGFDESNSSITVSGPIEVRGLYSSSRLKVMLKDKARIELVGEGDRLEAYLSGGAQLNAITWDVERANISAVNDSKAHIRAEEEIYIHTDASSVVYTSGPATVRKR